MVNVRKQNFIKGGTLFSKNFETKEQAELAIIEDIKSELHKEYNLGQ